MVTRKSPVSHDDINELKLAVITMRYVLFRTCYTGETTLSNAVDITNQSNAGLLILL